MPRPRKHRRICRKPSCIAFGPREGGEQSLTLSIDEYEAIRLIDVQGLTQEECAEQMQVARTTIQAIYANARRTLGRCIVEGCHLHIRGGNVHYCEQQESSCKGSCCKRGQGCEHRKDVP